jgi:predicted TPR repeat methyltransferase
MASSRLDTYFALHRSGRFAEAEAGYRACLNEGEDKAGFALAALLLQQQRYGEAAELLEPLAKARPDDADVATNLSTALRHGGRLDEARQAAQRACALAPRRPAAWNALGLAAFAAGRNEEALAAFEEGLRLAPGRPSLELHRAHCLRRLGRNREALPAYAQVVRADPRLLEGWRGLASVQTLLGQLDAALQSRHRALALAPHDRELAFEHASALLLAGRAEEAVRRLEAMRRGGVDEARLWDWLGRARLKLGDLESARTAFEQARARDPDDPTIAHFHASLTGVLPEAVESDYIRRLFDDFADHFDHALVNRLHYGTPRLMARFLREHGADAAGSVLDLGCGTGLMAAELVRPGRAVDGVDLSPRMLALAQAKGLYRSLHVAELAAFLRGTTQHWELVVATDVFIYVADLQPVFSAVLDRLLPGGTFAFSIECSDDGGTQLPPRTGRYRHAPARVHAELEQVGFAGVVYQPAVLRFEDGQPVHGALLLARRPAAAG